MSGTAVSRGVNPILTAIPGLAGTYALPQIVINAGGQITAISSLTTFTGNFSFTGTLSASAFAAAGPVILSAGSGTNPTLTVNATTSGAGLVVNQGSAANNSGLGISLNSVGTAQPTFLNFNAGSYAWSIRTNFATAGDFNIYNGSTQVLNINSSNACSISGVPIATSNTGTFTGTLTGMTATTTGTVYYSIVGKTCTLQASFNGTSNSTAMTLTGVPAACIPSVTNSIIPCNIENNGGNVLGCAYVLAGNSTISLYAGVFAALFTASGTKGLNVWSITYTLQ